MMLPSFISASLEKAHPGWRPCLTEGISRMMEVDSAYFAGLERVPFLPTRDRIFAAFSLPPDQVRFILVGESPYPREESATGYSFMDGAVRAIWSEGGFSKEVNRATSLRNFFKMLLVAEKTLSADDTGAKAIAQLRRRNPGSAFPYITHLDELQRNLHDRGFLLLNAALVFRRDVSPLKEAGAWLPFLQVVLESLLKHGTVSQEPLPVLVLWGNAAKKLERVEAAAGFPQVTSEHPYNLSFIKNTGMQELFGPANLLRAAKTGRSRQSH